MGCGSSVAADVSVTIRPGDGYPHPALNLLVKQGHMLPRSQAASNVSRKPPQPVSLTGVSVEFLVALSTALQQTTNASKQSSTQASYAAPAAKQSEVDAPLVGSRKATRPTSAAARRKGAAKVAKTDASTSRNSPTDTDSASLSQLTTADVVEQIIKPATAALKCAFVDLLPHHHISSAPQHYVVHAWKRPFSETTQMLQDHAKIKDMCVQASLAGPLLGMRRLGTNDASSLFVWLDVFCINQHEVPNSVAHVPQIMTAVSSTLLCCDFRAAALTRKWCLYEVWHAEKLRHAGTGSLRVLTPAMDPDQAMEDCMVTSAVDFLDARVSVESDAEMITDSCVKQDMLAIKLVEYQVESGIEHAIKADAKSLQFVLSHLANAGEMLAITGFVHSSASSAMDIIGGPENAALLVQHALKTACLMRTLVDPDTEKIEILLRATGKACHKLLGPGHPLFYTSTMALAHVLSDNDKDRLVEALYRDALSARQAVTGPDERFTVQLSLYFGLCLLSCCKYGEAEEVLRQAVSKLQTMLPADHPKVLQGLDALSSALQARGKLWESVECCSQILEAYKKRYGMEHIDTIGALNDMAWALLLQKQYDDAILLSTLSVQLLEKLKSQQAANENNEKGSGKGVDKGNQGGSQVTDAQSRSRQADRGDADIRSNVVGGDTSSADTDDSECDVNHSLWFCLDTLARILLAQGNLVEAEQRARQSLSIVEQLYDDDSDSDSDDDDDGYAHTIVQPGGDDSSSVMSVGIPAGALPSSSSSSSSSEGSSYVAGPVAMDDDDDDESDSELEGDTEGCSLPAAFCKCTLGVICAAMGKLDEAEGLAQEGFAVIKSRLQNGDVDIAQAMCDLAGILVKQNKVEGATKLYRGACDLYVAAGGPGHPCAVEIEGILAKLPDVISA